MKKEEICNTIIQKLKLEDSQGYREYFDMVYGKILADVDENISKQLISFETKRLDSDKKRDFRSSGSEEWLLKEYSKMAFKMATMSYQNIVDCKDLAEDCLNFFNQLINTVSASKKLISETILDFEYAGGNYNVSSLRLASFIKSNSKVLHLNKEKFIKLIEHNQLSLIKKFNNYYIIFLGGAHEIIPCFLKISDSEAEQIVNNPETISKFRDSYKGKIPWTEKHFIDSFIRDCLTYEYKLSEKRVKLNLEKLNKHEDIKLELYETVVYDDFPKTGKIEVCGYTAEDIKNQTSLSILGTYNYLIYLRENENEALEKSRNGLPIK